MWVLENFKLHLQLTVRFYGTGLTLSRAPHTSPRDTIAWRACENIAGLQPQLLTGQPGMPLQNLYSSQAPMWELACYFCCKQSLHFENHCSRATLWDETTAGLQLGPLPCLAFFPPALCCFLHTSVDHPLPQNPFPGSASRKSNHPIFNGTGFPQL